MAGMHSTIQLYSVRDTVMQDMRDVASSMYEEAVYKKYLNRCLKLNEIKKKKNFFLHMMMLEPMKRGGFIGIG